MLDVILCFAGMLIKMRGYDQKDMDIEPSIAKKRHWLLLKLCKA